jgi:hypothetical protein
LDIETAKAAAAQWQAFIVSQMEAASALEPASAY